MVSHAGFEVLMAVTVKSTVFWFVTPCSSERGLFFEEHTDSIFGVEE
jgi:hypothetical protein